MIRRAGTAAGLLLLLALVLPRAAAAAPSCAALRAAHDVPTIVSADPQPRAPRVFAMQVNLDPAHVRTPRTFAAKVECLLREHVLPFRARGRPNVVVFDETRGSSPRRPGAAARPRAGSRTGATTGAVPGAVPVPDARPAGGGGGGPPA